MTHDAVWVPRGGDNELTRVDIRTRHTASIPLRSEPDGMYPVAADAGAGKIWVVSGRFLIEIDPQSRKVLRYKKVGWRLSDVVFAYGHVWTSDCPCGLPAPQTAYVARIDPKTLKVTKKTALAGESLGLGAGHGAVWVAVNSRPGSVVRIDPDTGTSRETIDVGARPSDVVAARSGIWVSLYDEDRVVRIDPHTLTPDARSFTVGRHPWSLALGGGYVWVADANDGSLWRIDAQARRSFGKPFFPNTPNPGPQKGEVRGNGVAYAHRRAWMVNFHTAVLHSVKLRP